MRWIWLFVGAVVILGFFLLMDIQIPHMGWVGHLPGDLIIRKPGVAIFFPLSTSLITSLILSFILGFWRKKS